MQTKSIKPPYLIAYIALIVFALILSLTRWVAYFNESIKLPEFILAHITNFSLSLIIVLIIGFVALVFGGRMSLITAFCLVMIALNFICETMMSAMNTTDVVDALFGLCGVGIAYIFLFMLYKNGLYERK